MSVTEQLNFSFHGIRNSELFSNHWLEHRLVLEPEWTSGREAADRALEKLVELWTVLGGEGPSFIRDAPRGDEDATAGPLAHYDAE